MSKEHNKTPIHNEKYTVNIDFYLYNFNYYKLLIIIILKLSNWIHWTNILEIEFFHATVVLI
jgi:hypothetical protein